MTPAERKVMEQALEALIVNVIGTSGRMPKTHDAITALRTALEQPEPTKCQCDQNGACEYCSTKRSEPVSAYHALAMKVDPELQKPASKEVNDG